MNPVNPVHSLSLEQRILLAALRLDHAQDDLLRRDLAAGPDWPALRRLAADHGVLPLLYAHLQALAPGLIAPEPWASLSTMNAIVARRNARLAQELLRVLRLLADAGIDAIPFKGPVLALQAYGDLALRHFVDLDLLIPPHRLRGAVERLSGHGYAPLYPLTAKTARWLPRSYSEFLLRSPAVSLDIHWALADPGRPLPVSFAKAWAGAQRIDLQGVSVPALSPVHMLLVACEHGNKHAWQQLSWIMDVAHLLPALSQADLAAVASHARDHGMAKIVALALRLAVDVAGIALPQGSSLSAWLDPSLDPLVRQVRATWFASVAPAELPALAAPLRTRDWRHDRLYPVLAQLFAPKLTDWAAIDLPSALYPLYYLLRPLRLAAKHSRALVTSLRSRLFRRPPCPTS
jgi:hypothetical protein